MNNPARGSAATNGQAKQLLLYLCFPHVITITIRTNFNPDAYAENFPLHEHECETMNVNVNVIFLNNITARAGESGGTS